MGYFKNEELLRKFGNQVRLHRKEANLTQEDLAIEIGIEVSQISRIERGILNTSISMANEIAIKLNISIKDLFDF